MTTIKQLEETARQEEKTAEDYEDLARKGCARSEEYHLLAGLCKERRDEALLAIKVMKEAAQYNQFGKGEQDEQ